MNGTIEKLLKNGVMLKDIAILFRLNALSRSLEEGFNRAGIPYVLVGAIRFYERSEIKDVLSYFRAFINLEDDFSIARIINKPKRGIGKTTLDKLLNLAQQHHTSIFGLMQSGIAKEEVSKKAYATLQEFFAVMQDLQKSLRLTKDSF